MGLGISAVSKIRLVPCDKRAECDHDSIYVNPEFPDQADGLTSGCYVSDGETGDEDYPSRSYSGYNRFRANLCRVALDVEPGDVWDDPEAYEGKPFAELINFSDCEGVIGATTSAKLAKDFEVHEDAMRQQLDQYDFATYQGFHRAFKRASDGGAVMFH